MTYESPKTIMRVMPSQPGQYVSLLGGLLYFGGFGLRPWGSPTGDERAREAKESVKVRVLRVGAIVKNTQRLLRKKHWRKR